MAHLCRYANHPLAFIALYVSRRAPEHVTIVATLIVAVTCSVAAQYAVKILVDVLTGCGAANAGSARWWALLLLASLIAADNFLLRVASWLASGTFVRVTGDLRRDLFRHLTG